MLPGLIHRYFPQQSLHFAGFLTGQLFTKTGGTDHFAGRKNARNGHFLFFFEKKLRDFPKNFAV